MAPVVIWLNTVWVSSAGVMPSRPAQTGEVNVRKRNGDAVGGNADKAGQAVQTGDAGVNFCAGDEKIIHFQFFGGFAGSRRGLGGGRVGAGGAVHVGKNLVEIVGAEGIAFKGDFRRADFDGFDEILSDKSEPGETLTAALPTLMARASCNRTDCRRQDH